MSDQQQQIQQTQPSQQQQQDQNWGDAVWNYLFPSQQQRKAQMMGQRQSPLYKLTNKFVLDPATKGTKNLVNKKVLPALKQYLQKEKKIEKEQQQKQYEENYYENIWSQVKKSVPSKIVQAAIINPAKKAYKAADTLVDLSLSSSQAGILNPFGVVKSAYDAAKFGNAVSQLGSSLMPLGVSAYAIKQAMGSLKGNQAYKKYKQLQGQRQGYKLAMQLDPKYDFEKKITVKKIDDIDNLRQSIDQLKQTMNMEALRLRQLENSSAQKPIQKQTNNQKPLLIQAQQTNPPLQALTDPILKKSVLATQKMIDDFGKTQKIDNQQLMTEIKKQINQKQKKKIIKADRNRRRIKRPPRKL